MRSDQLIGVDRCLLLSELLRRNTYDTGEATVEAGIAFKADLESDLHNAFLGIEDQKVLCLLNTDVGQIIKEGNLHLRGEKTAEIVGGQPQNFRYGVEGERLVIVG